MITEPDQEWIRQCVILPQRQIDLSTTPSQWDALNNDEFCSLIMLFLRESPLARVRLLIDDYDPAVINQHQLFAQARRVSSKMSLRVIDDHPEWTETTRFIGDNAYGWVIRRQQPLLRLARPAQARPEAERFERLWQAGIEAPDFRYLS